MASKQQLQRGKDRQRQKQQIQHSTRTCCRRQRQQRQHSCLKMASNQLQLPAAAAAAAPSKSSNNSGSSSCSSAGSDSENETKTKKKTGLRNHELFELNELRRAAAATATAKLATCNRRSYTDAHTRTRAASLARTHARTYPLSALRAHFAQSIFFFNEAELPRRQLRCTLHFVHSQTKPRSMCTGVCVCVHLSKRR